MSMDLNDSDEWATGLTGMRHRGPIGAKTLQERRRTQPYGPIWILWNPDSELAPRVTYDSRKEAEEVAAKMAVQRGGTFYVMKAVSGIKGMTTVETKPVQIFRPAKPARRKK